MVKRVLVAAFVALTVSACGDVHCMCVRNPYVPPPTPAATAVRGVTLAAFQALAPGRADITATAGAACSPGQACPMYAMLYSVTVTVLPSR